MDINFEKKFERFFDGTYILLVFILQKQQYSEHWYRFIYNNTGTQYATIVLILKIEIILTSVVQLSF
jgi:hypothetical protein